MPIEFRCQQCGKLLRVGDETAGKQGKCPACGAVQLIPAGSAPEKPSPPPAASPFGSAPNAPLGGLGPEYQSDNPYAAPPAPMPPPSGHFYDSASGPRSGPPWERDGASVASYFATLKELLGSPSLMFSEMRREGGIGAPLLFGMAGGMAWGAIGLVLQLGIQSLIMGMAAGPGAGAPPPGLAMGMASGVGLVVGLVVLPLGLLLSMFLSSGIYHLMLMMLGAARQPFETTFRVVAYSTGAVSILAAIPLCGGYIQGITQLVYTGIGLCHAHEISGGKAAAAVVLPMVICCGGLIVVYAVVVAAFVAGGAGR